MQGMFKHTPALATVAAMQENYDRQDESRINQQKGLQDVLKAQQEFAFNEQNNPLRLANSRLVNQGLEADMPGRVADSGSKVLKLDMDRKTFDTTVDVANSDNALKVMKNNLQRYNLVADTLTSAAAEVKGLPPIMRGARLRQIMEASGMKVDSPAAASLMQEATVNPEALLKRAEEAKRRAAELTPEFIKQSMMEREHNKRNAADNVSREKVATTQANGRIAAVKAKAEGYKLKVQDMVRMGKLKANEIPAAYRAEAATETDPDVRAWLLQEAALAHQANLDRGNARAQPGLDENGNIIQNKPNNVYDKEAGGTPDIAAQAKAAWGGYDPQKYDYRVGPNGKLQRKEK